MIVYKINVLEELKKKGYTPKRLTEENLLGGGTIQNLRDNKSVRFDTLNTLCRLLECDVCDIIEHRFG